VTIHVATLECLGCGQPSEVVVTVERNGVLGHYPACMVHIEYVARRVRADASLRRVD
jgi:hypothetical protein